MVPSSFLYKAISRVLIMNDFCVCDRSGFISSVILLIKSRYVFIITYATYCGVMKFRCYYHSLRIMRFMTRLFHIFRFSNQDFVLPDRRIPEKAPEIDYSHQITGVSFIFSHFVENSAGFPCKNAENPSEDGSFCKP